VDTICGHTTPPYLATGYDEKVSSIRSAELPIYVSEIVARFGVWAVNSLMPHDLQLTENVPTFAPGGPGWRYTTSRSLPLGLIEGHDFS
jgi:hypothetical protein